VLCNNIVLVNISPSGIPVLQPAKKNSKQKETITKEGVDRPYSSAHKIGKETTQATTRISISSEEDDEVYFHPP
jgi:hypothetical protein